MEIKIQSGIPIPPRMTSNLSIVANKMNVGDCVDVPKSQAVNMCKAIRRVHGELSASMRSLDKETWRVWRTK